jgi:SAM-dependent methyltransferase
MFIYQFLTINYKFRIIKSNKSMANGQKTKLKGTYEQYGQSVAEVWDRLIDWEKREKAYGGFFEDLLFADGARRILDMSTGSGFDSIKLLTSGFDVTSLDGSSAMLKAARKNAKKHGVLGRFVPVVADWRSIGNVFTTKFDGAICLGNSICHLRPEERNRVLPQIRELLAKGGMFIVDYRNYDKILKDEPTGHGSYYLGAVDIKLNVEEGQVRPEYIIDSNTSFSLAFNPISIRTAIKELKRAGFSVRVYSDFKSGFDPNAAFYQLAGKAG